jgi:hypothetical protein
MWNSMQVVGLFIFVAPILWGEVCIIISYPADRKNSKDAGKAKRLINCKFGIIQSPKYPG